MKYTFIGILLIITGVIIILFGNTMIKNAGAYNADGTSIGEFLIMTTYQMGQIIEISGVVSIIVGIVLMIIGIFIPVKKSND